MCQLTSPSLKMVLELPSAAGIKTTAMRSGMRPLAFLPDRLAGSGTASGARPIRGAAAVHEIEQQPDCLRTEEENLGAVRQADEQVEAAENSHRSYDWRSGRPELALAIGLALPERQHRRAHRDERSQSSGVRQGGNG